ncbi:MULTISPECIES: 2-dehydropantoate 2-reductase [unclassified Ruegeria]|uniref:2-dehydropantoate 2-reductase n=1 Tax=unclassified Ruegeria TaxID=2625375 RepID=UPI001489D651|nr:MULTISPECIES: 2-dehydropantoate 2-reductase [unclassified Ruegeria]
MKIAIAAAGSIGCYVGGCLAHSGQDVMLLGRARVLDAIRSHGLKITDIAGQHQVIPTNLLSLTEDPTDLADADLVLVTVKTGATADMANLIAQYAPATAPVISLQNGMESARILRNTLKTRDVRAGMVPFNVVPKGVAAYHRATSGDIVIEDGAGDLPTRLSCPDLPISASNRIEAVQWGKLVVNLNNALNALSGLTVHAQLMDPGWRRLMADQMAEALGILKTAGVAVASTTPVPAWMVPHILRLPTPLFSRIASKMLTVDPEARTSMAYDMMAGRVTEIDSLQGEIIRLAAQNGVRAPLCSRVVDLILQARGDPMTPEKIRAF